MQISDGRRIGEKEQEEYSLLSRSYKGLIHWVVLSHMQGNHISFM